jgi:hypothetical protein
VTGRTLHTRVAWLDRWTIDGRRILDPTPVAETVPAIWHGQPSLLDPFNGIGRVGEATIHRQRLAGDRWHSLGATIRFDPDVFQDEFMGSVWTVDLRNVFMRLDDEGMVTLTGPTVAAVSGGPGIRWAWDDGTLPDPILWEGAD